MMNKKESQMVGKTKPMSQIKQLLLLHKQGQGVKFIARSLSLSKNTVKSYLQKLASSQLSLDALMELEAPALEAVFHAGSPAYKNDNERYHQFVSRLDYFLSELKRPGVTRHLLWEDYLHSHPKGYRYTQFCFHLDQHTKV